MEGETLYSFLIGRLRDLLAEEKVYLQALADPVDELAEMLTKMEELLEFAHVRKDKRASEIIDLGDHLIDSIETYVFQVANYKHTAGVRERFLRPKVRLAIEKITIKISDFIDSQSKEEDGNFTDPRRPYKVQDLSGFKEKDFVGREEDVNKLVSYLVDQENEGLRVISIYGMGGLGKTTLARKVYREEKVLSHFQSYAFVCVSEQCRADEILKHILQQLVLGNEEEIKNMCETDVIESLQKVLGEKKCLVIIDDIWSISDWESLNCGLHGSSCSKVLLTTRIKDVSEKGFCYSLKCLSEDECWELCQKTIFKDRDSEIEKRREELGRKMIAWCRGNPLAVLVLRGVLVTKYSLREWERFYESRTWGGEKYQQFNDEVVEELFFSYKELPYPLRPCFLYLATFPKDKKIDVETLYMLWYAEGMILSKDKEDGETMMDVAERYLGELVGRCMIEAKLDDEMAYPNVKRRYKFCWLHDLMRELCLSLVKKEDFLEVHDYRGEKDKVVVLRSSFQINNTKIPPRQALYFSSEHDFVVHDDKHKEPLNVRSLMFEAGRAGKLYRLKKLNLLRVLSFYDTSIGMEEITNEFIHLRYLSLKWCNIGRLPPSIYNFIYLQTLDMQAHLNVGDLLIIPNLALRKLTRLKHLFLPYEYKVTPNFSRLRLDGLTKLETLVNLHSKMCEMKDVIQLTNLRRLEWTIRISSEDDGKEMKEFMRNVNLDKSWHSSLAIDLVNPTVKMYSDVLRGKLPEYCEEIFHELEIRGVAGKLLPEFSSFCCLNVLVMKEFELEKDPMPILEKLSNLKQLSFNSGKLKGTEMTCSSTGFPKLMLLRFDNVENWEKWWVEEGAMPNLHCVWISGCSELLMLPDELKLITNFGDLKIRCMPEEFERSLINGKVGEGPDFYKIQPSRGWERYRYKTSKRQCRMHGIDTGCTCTQYLKLV